MILYVIFVSDDPEGIHSRNQGQSRSAPPAHLNLASIVHILNCSNISGSQIAPFIGRLRKARPTLAGTMPCIHRPACIVPSEDRSLQSPSASCPLRRWDCVPSACRPTGAVHTGHAFIGTGNLLAGIGDDEFHITVVLDRGDEISGRQL